jgi:hypothetical protein
MVIVAFDGSRVVLQSCAMASPSISQQGGLVGSSAAALSHDSGLRLSGGANRLKVKLPASFPVSRTRTRIVSKVAGVTRKESNGNGIVDTMPSPQRILLERLTQPTTSSTGAMEELELERGVCNPFRRYSSERVSRICMLTCDVNLFWFFTMLALK